MDRICIQLDEVVGKKLREEGEAKTELSASLRKARVEKLAKHQQENLEFDKLAQELHAMSEEMRELRKLYRKLQSSFHREDLLLDRMNSANGKLEADCNERLLKLEGENRDLVSSLDEAFSRIHDLERKSASSSEEISGLKRLLSIQPQLNSEMQKNASMDLKERYDYTLKLEGEGSVSQDQLEWKDEQFSSLLDENSSLQRTLDARLRASESLEVDFERCKAMLDESEQCPSHLQELLELEHTQAENIRNAVERVNFELQSKNSEIETLKFKLLMSESEVEIPKLKLRENQQAHEQEKTSLLVSVNEKEARIGDVELQLSMFKSVILTKSQAAEVLDQDRNCSMKKNLQHEITQKLAEREITNVAILDANDTLGRQENQKVISSFKEKHQTTHELEEEYQDFKSAMIPLRQEYMLDEVLKEEKILEVEEKNREISNLEKEMNRLPEKVKLQENVFPQSEQVALRHKGTKKSEIQELRSQLEKETSCFENLLDELESHKDALLEDRTEEKINRENLLAQLENMYQQIGFLCAEDADLMGMLRKSSLLYEEDSEPARNLSSSDGS